MKVKKAQDGSNSSSFETGQIKIASFAGQVAQTLIG